MKWDKNPSLILFSVKGKNFDVCQNEKVVLYGMTTLFGLNLFCSKCIPYDRPLFVKECFDIYFEEIKKILGNIFWPTINELEEQHLWWFALNVSLNWPLL